MELLEIASEYILEVLTENEKINKLPMKFIEESKNWVETWFSTLTDFDINESATIKKAFLDTKLEILASNPDFMKQLEEKINVYKEQKKQLRITHWGESYDMKNVCVGIDIKVSSFRIGDD